MSTLSSAFCFVLVECLQRASKGQTILVPKIPHLQRFCLTESRLLPLSIFRVLWSPTSAACLFVVLVESCRGTNSSPYIYIYQGLGVFATQAINAHELVAEYVGERVKLAEAEKRVARYRKAKLQVSEMRGKY